MKFDLQRFAIDYESYTDKALRKSARNTKRRIAEHEDKVAHPERYVDDWETRDARYRDGLILYWQKEIKNLQHQAQKIVEESERRGLE